MAAVSNQDSADGSYGFCANIRHKAVGSRETAECSERLAAVSGVIVEGIRVMAEGSGRSAALSQALADDNLVF